MQHSQDIIHSIFTLAPKNEVWRTSIKGLTIHAADHALAFSGYVQEPSLCVVLLGERQICTNGQCQIFSRQEMMFCPVNLPIVTQSISASENQPYLALSLQLDFELISQVIRQLPSKKISEATSSRHKWGLENEIEDCLIRLINLLHFPNYIEFLSPLILRELYFYLLQSEQGDYLRSLLSKEGNIAKIAQATEILAQQFAKPLNMTELARRVGMSVAGFYAHFKNVTAMTPLQYQKSLRLNVAREKLQSGLGVSETAYQIGYESPSQFSREYKRQFGESPSSIGKQAVGFS
ncbi:AraC family transcriptional regulator N-terminal domain-containing protein [Mannheimia sp. E30BD]|uniref:AraC family transcriptional regulator n=1 Tax=Mannheimia sp. E30BD TaxID=3278708 RepID=UPI00359D0369